MSRQHGNPPRPAACKQAFAVLITGLPASGKSTLATALSASLRPRAVRILDGDELRRLPGHPAGFSRAERNASVGRAAGLARDLVASGTIAICALIAPYQAARTDMRRTVQSAGGFLEVYLATPIEICRQRDPKGHYALAAAGKLLHFTGISDPYEIPEAPEVAIDTSEISIEQAVAQIEMCLRVNGYLGDSATPS